MRACETLETHLGLQMRKIASAIIHSSTKLLPAWFRFVAELALAKKTMPRDVATRWNSTFRMLLFALQYRLAIDALTQDRKLEMRKYELSEEEWTIVAQLCDILKVSHRVTAIVIVTKQTCA